MNRIIIALAAFALFFTSCQEKFDGYKLEGTLKGVPNTDLKLEFLTFSGTEVIDTSKTDENGKYALKGMLKEPGFYRLAAGEKSWILFLENTKVGFDANGEDELMRDVTVKNYPRGLEFQKALNFIFEQQDRISELSQRYQMMQFSGASQEDLMAVQMEFEVIDADIKSKLKDYASKEKDPIIAIYILSSLDLNKEFDFVKERMTSITAEAPSSSYVIQFNERIAQVEQSVAQQKAMEAMAQKTAVGTEAPDIVMKNPQGVDMKLSDLRGKVVLIDFWAAWCKPCRLENPNVVAAYNKYKSKGFEVFSVSLDKDRESWVQAIKDDGLIWNTHVSDLQFWQNAAAQLYGVQAIPAAFLIDRDGIIVGRDLRGDALEAKIKEVI